MDYIYIEVDENANCMYFPMQMFEASGNLCTASQLLVPQVSGANEAHVVVGWCGKAGGAPCEVRYTLVGDSGAGISLLIAGGEFGLRLKPASSDAHWDLNNPLQFGEPYLLLDPEVKIRPL